jgi:hypothetical protein
VNAPVLPPRTRGSSAYTPGDTKRRRNSFLNTGVKSIMQRVRSRYFLPVVMIPLFLLAFVRADLRWRDCSRDDGRVCFNYPAYLRYETRQALDLHWLPLLPAALFRQLPDSISPAFEQGPQNQVLRYIVTISGVLCFWWLVGLWWERLFAGRRIDPRRRKLRWCISAGTVVLALLVALSVSLGMQGSFEGPTMTDSGFLVPGLLTGMAFIECGVFARLRQATNTQPVVVATLLLCLFVWVDINWRAEYRAYQGRNKPEVTDSRPGVVTFSLSFSPSPHIQDALALQAPALLIVAMPQAVSSLSPDSGVLITFRYLAVWLYWYALATVMFGLWPANTRVYGVIRTPLAILYGVAFGFTLLGWVAAASAHGPTPALAGAIGAGAGLFALSRREPHQ